MKIATTVLAAALSLLCSGLARASDCDVDMLMTASQIGPVKLGMTEADVAGLDNGSSVSVVRHAHYSEESGADEVEYFVTICGDAEITAEFYSTSSVYEISTQSPAFVTVESARVGMAAGELQSIYESGRSINFWNEGMQRTFIIDDGEHGVFTFGDGRCEIGRSTVRSECNAVLPDEVSVSYWTNSAYTKPGRWN